MAREVATIHIDSSAIWVLVAKGRQLRKWANMPLEPGMVKDGVIQDEDAVASKVRDLWKKQRIGRRRVVAGISGINCLYRLIALPELSASILPEAVKREASRTLGVPMEQLHLSWQTLPSIRDETLVYLAASPKNSVDSVISTLRKAGLDPYLMDLKPLAMARVATEPKAIIIDLQPASFDVVVTVEGIPHVVRSLALAPESSLEEKLPVVKGELDRAITFYNSSHADKPIEPSVPLLVCGELAQQEDAWNLLLGRQSRPVQALPLPMETPKDFPPGQYVANIGLAIKELLASEKGAIAYSLVNFNALPEVYIPKRRPLSQILLVPAIIVGIALVAWAVNFNINVQPETSALRAQLAALDRMALVQLAQAKDVIALGKEVSSVEATADAFTSTLNSFTDGRGVITQDLSQINAALSAGGITLGGVAHTGGEVTVTGLAADQNAVLNFARYLRGSGRFNLVVITEMQKDEAGTSFALMLTK